MKTLLLSPAREMNTPALRQLTVLYEEVIETSVTDLKLQKVRFTASDMWNRHRKMRSASDLVRKWDLN